MTLTDETKTKHFTTTIAGYTVELDLYKAGTEPSSDCTITKRIGARDYWSSLAALQNTGILYSGTGDMQHEIDANVLDRITAWAEKNGY